MTRSRFFVLILVPMLLVTACGGSGDSGDPKEQLVNAVSALEGDAGGTFTFSLVSDRESLRALSAEGGEPLDDATIDRLLGASLALSLPFDPDDADGVVAVALNSGGAALFEMRGAQEGDVSKVYLRVDVPALLELFGQPADMVTGIEQFVGAGLPSGTLRGNWVLLEGAEEMLKELAAEQPTESPEEVRATIERLTALLADAADVSRAGSDDAGTHLVASVNLRDAATVIRDEAPRLGLPLDDMPDISEVPDEAMSVDLWVRDGKLSRIELDALAVGRLDPEAEIPAGAEQLRIRIDVSPYDARAELPADAAPLDLEALMGSVFGMFGGFMGEGMAPDMGEGVEMGMDPMEMFGSEEMRLEYCEGIRDMPQDFIEENFADVCPELVG